MTHRRYATADLIVDVRELDADHVRLNIEHKSGAALLVPRAKAAVQGTGDRIETTGFDGTTFIVDIDDAVARIQSSAPSVILGGETSLEVPRVEVKKKHLGPLRVTGDEETMPIQLEED